MLECITALKISNPSSKTRNHMLEIDPYETVRPCLFQDLIEIYASKSLWGNITSLIPMVPGSPESCIVNSFGLLSDTHTHTGDKTDATAHKHTEHSVTTHCNIWICVRWKLLAPLSYTHRPPPAVLLLLYLAFLYLSSLEHDLSQTVLRHYWF
jgi:hypothetical protein